MRLSNRWGSLTMILLAFALLLPRAADAQSVRIVGVAGGAT